MTHVEVFVRLDKSDAAHLKQIVRLLAAVGKTLYHAENEPEIAGKKLLSRLLVTCFCGLE